MNRQDKWDVRFIEHAKFVSSYSKDPSTRVGAVITDGEFNIRSIGYNGFPRGVEDSEERLENRPLKYKLVTHAEANAVATCARLGVKIEGCTLYCTLFPCTTCCGIIIQSGIRRVVVPVPSDELVSRWGDDFALSTIMFNEAGVEIKYITT